MKRLLLLLFSPLLLFSQSPAIKLNLVASGFGQVTDIVSAGDSRLFIVDAKQVKIFINGKTLTSPFLNLSDRASQ